MVSGKEGTDKLGVKCPTDMVSEIRERFGKIVQAFAREWGQLDSIARRERKKCGCAL